MVFISATDQPLPGHLPVLYASRPLLKAIQSTADHVPASLWEKAVNLAKVCTRIAGMSPTEKSRGVCFNLVELLNCNFVCVLLEAQDFVEDHLSQVRHHDEFGMGRYEADPLGARTRCRRVFCVWPK
jgi:hypothetical protein